MASERRKFGGWSHVLLYLLLLTILEIVSSFAGGIGRPFLSIGTKHVGANGLSRLDMGKSEAAKARLSARWLPYARLHNGSVIEQKGICFAAALLIHRLNMTSSEEAPDDETLQNNNKAYNIAKGRFRDLTCTLKGERVLESLFQAPPAAEEDDEDVIYAAIYALQSMCITGTQSGLTGPQEFLRKRVSHLASNESDLAWDLSQWTAQSTQRLKYEVDQSAGIQLLAEIKRKQSSLGAFELLVRLGAWEKHEDLRLLRSGFSIVFTPEEEMATDMAMQSDRDPDTMLGLRKDLRGEKVFTIDGAFATEVDDGLSVQAFEDPDGTTRHKYWIHIADADRWVPRDSKVLEAAESRGTSVYLPRGTLPMFPPRLGNDCMSLRPREDVCALSMGLELDSNGAIIPSSIEITPSIVSVSYRLTYQEADEMLSEGVGYHEEWQLGALMMGALKRRKYRIYQGSIEGMVPAIIPSGMPRVTPNKNAKDGLEISIEVEAPRNAANQTQQENGAHKNVMPLSDSSLLVMEMMVMAGEALGKWYELQTEDTATPIENTMQLPFRSQSPPDFMSRPYEFEALESLRVGNKGNGYCHAWFFRRFLTPFKIDDYPRRHFCLGLDCYVQWSSPIRRFSDLQTQCVVKRFIRRQRLNELLREGRPFPVELTSLDVGFDISLLRTRFSRSPILVPMSEIDKDIDILHTQGSYRPSRTLERESRLYWTLEYIARRPSQVFDAVVLGCVDYKKKAYTVYLPEIGLEYRYMSERGFLDAGEKVSLTASNINPAYGIMKLALAPRFR